MTERAPIMSSVRRYLSPTLVIRLSFPFPPERHYRGTKPSYTASCLPFKVLFHRRQRRAPPKSDYTKPRYLHEPLATVVLFDHLSEMGIILIIAWVKT